jgi:hypothetical protein
MSREIAEEIFDLFDRRRYSSAMLLTSNRLCGAPHNRFNAKSIFMRTPRSLSTACCHLAGFSLCITTEVFSRSISLSVALKRPVRSFGAITDSKASSFTLGSARV